MAETGSLGVNMVEFVLGGGSPTNRNAQDRNRMTGAFVSILLFVALSLCFCLSPSICPCVVVFSLPSLLFLSPCFYVSSLSMGGVCERERESVCVRVCLSRCYQQIFSIISFLNWPSVFLLSFMGRVCVCVCMYVCLWVNLAKWLRKHPRATRAVVIEVQ